ncbi:MAG: cation:proton antiporter [Planctomycetaceae bacterium]|nr:cation:proton antiporter [Planctomycetaceae bacterium]
MAGSTGLKSVFRRRRTVSWRMILAFAILTIFAWSLKFVPPVSALPAANAAMEPVLVSAADEQGGHDGGPVDEATDSGRESSSADSSGGATDASENPAAHEAGHASGHDDPVAEVLLAITIILLLAKIVGDGFERIGMPAVLGELVVGILLGNWEYLTGFHMFDFFKPHLDGSHALTGSVIDMLARIGVVLLLFEVGLESRVKEMMSVGLSSLLVAVLGVVVPIGLGFGVGYLAQSLSDSPDGPQGWQVPAFLGATLCATSVGITARVLKDIGAGQARESRIILGAAVLDDVLGLVVLAVVSGIILEGSNFQPFTLVKIVGMSIGFLAVALAMGAIQLPRMLFRAASFLRGRGLLVATALVICFGFSWAANKIAQLAPIIGAFAAGLILEGAHYQEVGDKWRNRRLEDALAPLSALLVPVFFVAMGTSVELSAFSDSSVLILATGLTVAAVVGKLACCFGVREKGLNVLAVGLGMIPRGEVGLIFAGQGRELKVMRNGELVSVVDDGTFSAIVVMVMVTTMVTPPLLKWAMAKYGSSIPEKSSPDTHAGHGHGHDGH